MSFKLLNRPSSFCYATSMSLLVIVLAGCTPLQERPLQVTAPKESVIESLDFLRLRSQNVVPLKATGQCRLLFFSNGKEHKENFTVQLWMNPPAQIRVHGDVAFNPRGIDIGSNQNEFWLAMKPKEVGNSYYWGKWSEQDDLAKLRIDPKLMLEAFGIVTIGSTTDCAKHWSLSKQSGFDILTQTDEDGRLIKKMYINASNYLVRKILYFNDDGRVLVMTELSQYKSISADFSVPTVVNFVTFAEDKQPDSFKFMLQSVKPYKFAEEKLQDFFSRPKPRGYKSVYRIAKGDMIPEE